jgi:dsDNA-binding SOS-regulon protein
MVQKYAHLSSEHLAQWVKRKPVVLAENSSESGTFFTTGNKKGLSN